MLCNEYQHRLLARGSPSKLVSEESPPVNIFSSWIANGRSGRTSLALPCILDMMVSNQVVSQPHCLKTPACSRRPSFNSKLAYTSGVGDKGVTVRPVVYGLLVAPGGCCLYTCNTRPERPKHNKSPRQSRTTPRHLLSVYFTLYKNPCIPSLLQFTLTKRERRRYDVAILEQASN